MKKFCSLIILLFCLSSVHATSNDTIRVSDYGAQPNSFENQVTAIAQAISACKSQHAKVLVLAPGRYDIWPDGATRKEYYISNSSTDKECPSKVKTIGLFFDHMKDLTIEGNGAMLMFHGKMITMAFDHCENMKVQNLHIDFERPTASELRFTKVEKGQTEVTFHPDTRYTIRNGQIILYGEGWQSKIFHSVLFDPDNNTFVYTKQWKVLNDSKAEEVAPHVVRFYTPADFQAKVGTILTVRDIIRDQVGIFLLECKDMTLRKLNLHYLHAVGVFSMYTENITMDSVRLAPRKESGRILTTSADMMQFSGCKGKILIDGCYYSGAQDDHINIHGTNLRIIRKTSDNTAILRFMHGQSYGYNAYFVGDEVAFLNASRMERTAKAIVKSVKMLSTKEVEVTFDRPIPKDIEIGHDCVENLTCTPEVEIRNSYFTRVNTRGILVTTPRKVVIEGNTFFRIGMSAILISGDAENWFESGSVCDVLIRNNTFTDCGFSGGEHHCIITIEPSNRIIDSRHTVHNNIRIEHNVFQTFDYPILYAKSTGNLIFKNNLIERTALLPPVSDNHNAFTLNGCSRVVITGNTFKGNVLSKSIRFENMSSKDCKTDLK
jgi:polygalacturonase